MSPRFRRLYRLGVILLFLPSSSHRTTVQAIQLPFRAVTGTAQEDTKQKDHPGGGTFQQENHKAEAGGNKGTASGTSFHLPPTATPDPSLAGTLLISMLWEKGRTILQHHLETQQKVYQQIYSLLMYKPPMGFVTVFTVFQLIASGRIFHVYNNQHHPSQIIGGQGDEKNGHDSISSSQNGPAIMQQEHRKPKKRRLRGRAFSLDERDQAYVSYGVMEQIRGRLCVAALADIVEQEEELNPEFASDRSSIFRYKRRLLLTKKPNGHTNATTEEHLFQVPWIFGTALDALSLSCPPGGSRGDYVDQLREPLSRLRAAEVYHEAQSTTVRDPKASGTINPTILQVATMILEIRATDAILRVCRDRLLKTTYRLARTVKYWDRRVEQAKTMALIQQSLIRNTIDGDRLRLSYAQAAYHAELDRLGRICAMLLIEKHQPADSQDSPGRPKELQDIHLLRALQRSKRANGLYQQLGATPFNGASRQEKRKWRSTWRLPKLSRYSLRIDKGKISLHHLEKDTFIEGVSAMKVLMEDDPEGLKEWYADATAWVQNGKRTLCEVLREAMITSVPNGDQQHSPLSHDIDMIQEAWDAPVFTTEKRRELNDNSEALSLAMAVCKNNTLAWERALHVVEDVKGFRRVGEGRTIGFGELSFVGWLNEFDFFGIPFALVKIYLAYRLHEWIKPHWPAILQFLQSLWQTCLVFFMTRFWEPVKGVMLDILNKDEKTSMLEDFNLLSEEHSLDSMLKDLGYGDGTKRDRYKALEAATKQYEEDLRTGLFRTVASGQLVRLLLVQMQQLKLGMLNAIQDIDVLLQANKLNMRVFATIPAFFLISVGTRMFARHLYNVRSRDLRPITEVHEEMQHHLHRMKSILLLANGASFSDSSRNVCSPNKSAINLVESSVKVLGPIDLGEFALRMHCYLVLLDFCSPKPFPKRQCDSLHQSIREVLGSLKKTRPEPATNDVERSIALVDLVIKQHQGLRKYL